MCQRKSSHADTQRIVITKWSCIILRITGKTELCTISRWIILQVFEFMVKSHICYQKLMSTFTPQITAPEPNWNQDETPPLTVWVWGAATFSEEWKSWIRDTKLSIPCVVITVFLSFVNVFLLYFFLCSSSVWSHPSLLIHRVERGQCAVRLEKC